MSISSCKVQRGTNIYAAIQEPRLPRTSGRHWRSTGFPSARTKCFSQHSLFSVLPLSGKSLSHTLVPLEIAKPNFTTKAVGWIVQEQTEPFASRLGSEGTPRGLTSMGDPWLQGIFPSFGSSELGFRVRTAQFQNHEVEPRHLTSHNQGRHM